MKCTLSQGIPLNSVSKTPECPRTLGWEAPDSKVLKPEGAGRPRGSGRRLSALTDGWGGSDRTASAGLKTTTAASLTETHGLEPDFSLISLQNKTK